MADRIQRGEDCHQGGRDEDGGAYDHDGISAHDLIELGLAGLASEAGETKAEEVEYAFRDNAGVCSIGSIADVPESSVDATFIDLSTPEDQLGNVSQVATATAPDTAQDDTGSTRWADWGSVSAEPDDLEDQGLPAGDSLDALWLQPVPELDEGPTRSRAPQDGVSSSERAIQLALAFLQSEGISSRRNLDFLVDIIQERGWTSVQFHVRGLVRAGYDTAQVHRMFELTDAWHHCVDSDTLAPERWHGGKRLTWVEAAQLLDFLGYDADLDQIADFLSVELEIWQELRRNSGQLATFKNYLFGYRLSPRTQVDDGIWQVNLDPDDERSFDGTRNPLCNPEWWDEPVDGNAWTVRQILGACHDLGGLAEWLAPEERGYF